MPRKIEYIVNEEYDGCKVKQFLKGEAKLSSKLMISLKKYDDGMTLNGVKTRTIDIIKKGDRLAINIPDQFGEIEPIEMELDILFEDEDFIVINKSPFLAIHPTRNHQGDTLANALVFHLKNQGKPTVFRAVGRLDKGTSGIVVCALNSHSASRLQGAMSKEYLAVATGKTKNKATIDAPIYRPDPMKTLRSVGEGGARAVTHFEKIKGNEGLSLVHVWLETGRTHQIRVHFAHIGHALVGDSFYGTDESGLGHQLLHCAKVSFEHPITGKKMSFEAPMPADMQKIADEI